MAFRSAKRGSDNRSDRPIALANVGQADCRAASMNQRPSPLWYGLVIAFTGAVRSCSSYGVPPASAADTRVPVAHTPVARREVPTLAPLPVRSRWYSAVVIAA